MLSMEVANPTLLWRVNRLYTCLISCSKKEIILSCTWLKWLYLQSTPQVGAKSALWITINHDTLTFQIEGCDYFQLCGNCRFIWDGVYRGSSLQWALGRSRNEAEEWGSIEVRRQTDGRASETSRRIPPLKPIFDILLFLNSTLVHACISLLSVCGTHYQGSSLGLLS